MNIKESKKRDLKNKESQSQQAAGYSLSLQMDDERMNQKQAGSIRPIWSNKAQVTMFIIIALLIVVLIVLIYINWNKFTGTTTKESPVSEIRNCIQGKASERGSIENLTTIMSLQGGSIDPKNYILYQGNKVEYLCYTSEYYKGCVMQKPLLKQNIQDELKNYLGPKAKTCVEIVKASLEKKGYRVSSKEPQVNVEINPGDILTTVDLDMEVTKDKTESYKTILIDKSSKIYNFAMIASSIANWEASFGNSETINYMMYYPDLRVEKKKQGEGTTVYIITDKISEEKFMFAIRSYAMPAGVTGN